MVTSSSVYLVSFISFTVSFAVLREIGYPRANQYIRDKKVEVECEIDNLKSSFDFNTFKRLHSKLHEYERLKLSIDRYIVCSKWSCVSVIISSLIGLLSIYTVILEEFQNVIDFLLTLGTIIFFVSTTSIPTVSEWITKIIK